MDRHLRHRPVRFLMVGLACAVVQFLLVATFIRVSAPATLANAGGLLLSAQLNFALSQWFTWRDRGQDRLVRRWLMFLAVLAIAGTANTAVFSVLDGPFGTLTAAVGAMVPTVIVKYLVNDRGIFKASAGSNPPGEPATAAAL